ncbi:MAG TPA: FAD:protein FMN transferase [Chitinispirillaceae bacterium]|nr:FAD:protein FMN transferase [Chitinispirillaceae bacterium]
MTLRILFTLLAVVCMCEKSPECVSHRFFKMDTITDITVVKNHYSVQTLWNSADSLLKDWEERFSVSGTKSEIRLLNERSSDTMIVSEMTAQIIKKALEYGDTLDGGFDLTILPIKELWGFGEHAKGDEPFPSASQVDSALRSVSYKNVRIHDDTVFFLSKDTRIDVGGIAKGFVLRELQRLVTARGYTDYLIAAGGDIVSGGNRPDKKPWRIGIQHPRAQDSILAAVDLDSGSIVTSGDYERFRVIDGKRYHHIFNSHTGYSCTGNQSVTIYGPDPVTVDILSTGLYCRSAADIAGFINKRPRFQCMVVDSSGVIYFSDGWKNKIELMN